VFLQAWYQGGLSVIDFTDSANPFEIAYFDRGPINNEKLITGGFWSTYYYDGRIYGSEITRGLDVLALEPSKFLSAGEIAAAAMANNAAVFNPQQQFAKTWPQAPMVATAYVDQLARSGALAAGMESELRSALAGAETALAKSGSPADNAGLARRLEALSANVTSAATMDARTAERRAALSSALKGLAARLR